MRLSLLVLVLAVLCALCAAQTPTPSALDTPVFVNIAPTLLNESLISITPLKGVMWTSTGLVAWTDNTDGAFLHALDYATLSTQGNATFATNFRSFRVSGDFAVLTGLLTGNSAYLWGSSVLYRLPDVSNLSDIQSSVTFPNLMLSRTGFELGGLVYSPQWGPSGTPSPQLFATDPALYSSGYAASTTLVGDLVYPEMTASTVSGSHVFVGYGSGVLEARDGTNVSLIVATVRIQNAAGTFGLQISEIVVDSTNNLLYVVGTQQGYGWVGRLNTTDLVALDGLPVSVYDTNDITGNFPNVSSSPALWSAFLLSTNQPILATNMAIDFTIGVGYANVNEQVNHVSYLIKFDAVNMVVLGGSESDVPILTREQTLVVGLHMTNGSLFMATESSVAVIGNYPTSCSSDCFASAGHGVCVRSVCQCTSNWTGLACDEKSCPAGCGEPTRGICRNGQCQCTANYTGQQCQNRRCESDCNGHGTCDTSTYTCVCSAKYKGSACQLSRFSSCEGLNEDKDAINLCIKYDACGWCFDEGVCKEGTRAGPVVGSCRQWLVDSTYDIITVVFGAIIIFCFLVMFIINVISALMEDWKLATIMSQEGTEGDSMLARTQWWRDERSAKSWKLWDQLQFISYFSIINAVFSTRLIQFAGYFNWANFSLPAIFVDKTSIKLDRKSTFVTASIEQYSNAHGMTTKMTYVNALIWWLIATAAFLILYLAYYVVVVFMMKKGGRFKEILLHRVFHIITRALLAGYLPLVLLACLYISNWQDAMMAVPIIFGLLIAIGVPVLNFLVVKGEKTDFLYYSLRIRFGAFYVSYQHTRTKFAFIVFARKFLVAALIGFLATKTIDTKQEVLFWVQSLIPAGLMLIYIVLLIVFNPYIDLVHTILDIVLNLINIITLATAYLHRSKSVDDKVAGVFVAMILQIAGLVFVIFAYLWTWLFYAGYTSPGQLCSGKPEADEGKKDGGKAAPAKGDDAGKKKDDVKGVNEANLKDLEISESDS